MMHATNISNPNRMASLAGGGSHLIPNPAASAGSEFLNSRIKITDYYHRLASGSFPAIDRHRGEFVPP